MSLVFLLVLILLSNSFFKQTLAWEKEEHKILANLVLDSTLVFCNINTTDTTIIFPGRTGEITLNKKLWNNLSFGNISAFYSGDDISQSRCQLKGNTVKQQLEPITAALIEEVWNRIRLNPDDIQSVEVSNQNVVFNYILYHLIALNFARLSGSERESNNETLRYALIYEAVALSYLSDAFSAGHLLLSVSDILTFMNGYNIQIAHDYYSSEGVYVINSKGDCWQAFGDKLLQWYPYCFSQVFEACTFSLRELFLVYYTSLENIILPENLNNWIMSISNGITPAELSNLWLTANNGDYYYSEIKMTPLLCVPIPVTAAWSVRTNEKDEFGIHQHRSYPQMKEEKYHDPDLTGIDEEFLYSKNSMPDWMIPDFLPNDTLQNLIKYNPEEASVRYIQNRNYPPSYRGYLLIAGVTYAFTDDRNKFGTSLGFGWGFTDKLLFLFNKPTIYASAMWLFGDNKEWYLFANIGVGIDVSIFGIFKPEIEIGSAWGFESPYKGYAGYYAFGVDSETLPLGFTYAGLTFRLKYQVVIFDKAFHSPVLEIILH